MLGYSNCNRSSTISSAVQFLIFTSPSSSAVFVPCLVLLKILLRVDAGINVCSLINKLLVFVCDCDWNEGSAHVERAHQCN